MNMNNKKNKPNEIIPDDPEEFSKMIIPQVVILSYGEVIETYQTIEEYIEKYGNDY